MTKTLNATRLSTQKLLLIATVIICLLASYLSFSLLTHSYQNYQDAKVKNEQFVQVNTMVGALTAIGRERGFANEVVFAKKENKKSAFLALIEARKDTDQHIQQLNPQIFTPAQWDTFYRELKKSRDTVEQYKNDIVQTPEQSRQAVNGMLFSSKIFHNYIIEASSSRIQDQESTSNPFLKVLTLSELRDSTGRLAAPFLTSLYFDIPITIHELTNSVRRLERIQVSWMLLKQIQDDSLYKKRFKQSLAQAEAHYSEKSKALIERLNQRGFHGQPYHLSAAEFSKVYRSGLADIEVLQRQYIDGQFELYQSKEKQALNEFITVVICQVVIVLVLAAILIYVQRHLLSPLFKLNLAAQDLLAGKEMKATSIKRVQEVQALFEMFETLDTQMKEQQRQSLEDPLTHLPNRRKFTLDAQALIEQCPKDQMLTLSYIDLDYFKRVNDTWGHATGDLVLSSVGLVLRQYLSENQCVARLGGEEFVIFFSAKSVQERDEILQELQQNIRDLNISTADNTTIKVTASFGACSSNAMNLEQLLDAADKALYQAKNQGRDRICYSDLKK